MRRRSWRRRGGWRRRGSSRRFALAVCHRHPERVLGRFDLDGSERPVHLRIGLPSRALIPRGPGDVALHELVPRPGEAREGTCEGIERRDAAGRRRLLLDGHRPDRPWGLGGSVEDSLHDWLIGKLEAGRATQDQAHNQEEGGKHNGTARSSTAGIWLALSLALGSPLNPSRAAHVGTSPLSGDRIVPSPLACNPAERASTPEAGGDGRAGGRPGHDVLGLASDLRPPSSSRPRRASRLVRPGVGLSSLE